MKTLKQKNKIQKSKEEEKKKDFLHLITLETPSVGGVQRTTEEGMITFFYR